MYRITVTHVNKLVDSNGYWNWTYENGHMYTHINKVSITTKKGETINDALSRFNEKEIAEITVEPIKQTLYDRTGFSL